MQNNENGLRKYLIVGQITAPHGIDGAVRIKSMTDDPERFCKLKNCFLLNQEEQVVKVVMIQSASFQKNRILVHLAGCESRAKAESLKDHYLAVSRDQAIPLPPDCWFICDLIGCAVFDEQDGYLGKVSEILQSPAQDVYVVAKEGEPDLLFPSLKSILRQVDLKARRIDVRLPDGLFEIYRERRD
ncbi:MAG: 16S rRNA processing protein RimM [Clostridia bacterium]|nr:16S rRNA processing protein RimM [Clostridia bacterium]